MTVGEVLRDVAMVTGLSAGAGACAAAAGALAVPVATGALLGGATAACGFAIAVLNNLLNEELRKVVSIALWALAGAVLAGCIATLAGFTITVLDVGIIAAGGFLVSVSYLFAESLMCPSEAGANGVQ